MSNVQVIFKKIHMMNTYADEQCHNLKVSSYSFCGISYYLCTEVPKYGDFQLGVSPSTIYYCSLYITTTANYRPHA